MEIMLTLIRLPAWFKKDIRVYPIPEILPKSDKIPSNAPELLKTLSVEAILSLPNRYLPPLSV